MKALQQNKIYKLEKRRQKEIDRKKEMIDQSFASKLEKFREAIEKKKLKEKKRWGNRIERKYKNKIREVKKQKPLKEKPKTVKYYKDKAFSAYQYCIRFDAQDEGGYVMPIDNPQEFRRRNGVDAGHIFPKSNYPQLAFYNDNVRPQTKQSNRMQLDGVGFDCLDEIERRIGKARMKKLLTIAESPDEKRKALEQHMNRSFRIKKCEFRSNEKKKREKSQKALAI